MILPVSYGAFKESRSSSLCFLKLCSFPKNDKYMNTLKKLKQLNRVFFLMHFLLQRDKKNIGSRREKNTKEEIMIQEGTKMANHGEN